MARLAHLVALIAVLLAAGCRQSPPTSTAAESLQIAVTAGPNPPVTGDAQLVVTVKDTGGSPISDATLSVRGDMTHAGMTPVIHENVTGQNGVYTVPFQWTMAGDWIVEVTVKLKDGTTTTRTFKYSVGEGSGSMSIDATAEATVAPTMAGMSMDMNAPLTPNRGGG